jgi:hypothetical protein
MTPTSNQWTAHEEGWGRSVVAAFGNESALPWPAGIFFILAPVTAALCGRNRSSPCLLLRTLFGARRTLPLDGLIWPETGCASIA